MASPSSLGIAKEIVTNFMAILGQNSPRCADYFSDSATFDWNSIISNGKLAIFEALKEVPLFTHQIIEFDCQTIQAIPTMTLLTSDGFLHISGRAERYHATSIITMTADMKCAHINYFALALI